MLFPNINPQMIQQACTAAALAMIATGTLQGPVQAAKPAAVDYFSAGVLPGKGKLNTPPASAGQGSFPANSNPGSQAVKWFEKFDDQIYTHKATEADRVILSRPFNQEAERVTEWADVAGKVAKRYRDLCGLLRQMPVPASLAGLKDYRDLTADWYADAAGVYEDLIKPRPPAKTMEELDAALDDIKARSQTLAQTSSNLKSMDMSLRRTYRVHLPRYEDALQQYVRSK